MNRARRAIAIAAAISIASCGEAEPAIPVAQEPAAVEDLPPPSAERKFTEVCAACHGTDGRGEGPAAELLPVKPRDWTDAGWQASVTDEGLAAIIVEGGAAHGLDAMMPASSELRGRPDIVAELVKTIRSYAN